jgi:uncharacterized RDD family membrane protein YckC
MQYEDRITISTPEGLDLELALAGLGSRFTSGLVDLLIEVAILAGLAVAVTSVASEAVAAAVVALGAFAVVFGYHVLWETLGSGRTPGKRLAGLRVVGSGGGPVRFRESAVRNIVRLVDLMPPITYFVGAVSILVTSRNQRLGDLAAGTLVVRAVRRPAGAPPVTARSFEGLERWDVSAVTTSELTTVRRFLDRRESLSPQARQRLATDLAARLRPKVAGSPPEASDEHFLEGLATAKLERS